MKLNKEKLIRIHLLSVFFLLFGCASPEKENLFKIENQNLIMVDLSEQKVLSVIYYFPSIYRETSSEIVLSETICIEFEPLQSTVDTIRVLSENNINSDLEARNINYEKHKLSGLPFCFFPMEKKLNMAKSIFVNEDSVFSGKKLKTYFAKVLIVKE